MLDRYFKNFAFFLIIGPGIFLSKNAYENLVGVSALVVWEGTHLPKLSAKLNRTVTNLGQINCNDTEKVDLFRKKNAPITPKRGSLSLHYYSPLAFDGPFRLMPTIDEFRFVELIRAGEAKYIIGENGDDEYYAPIGQELSAFAENCSRRTFFDREPRVKRNQFFDQEFYDLWKEYRKKQREEILPAIQAYKKSKWKILSVGLLVPFYTIISWTFLVFWFLHYRISWAVIDENPRKSKKELAAFNKKAKEYFRRNSEIDPKSDLDTIKEKMKKNREDLDLDLD